MRAVSGVFAAALALSLGTSGAIAQVFDANGNPARIITVDSAAGRIKVSAAFAPRIVPLIARLVDAGFRGRVHCYAERRGGHVRRSAHLSGNACDFLPRGRQARGHNRMPTPSIMFTHRVAAMIADAGLRNGCAFNDCGHIDNRAGLVLVARRHHHIARRHRRVVTAGGRHGLDAN